MSHDRLTTAAHHVMHWSREQPRAIAVAEGDISYSYAMLARNIVQAARALAVAGVGSETIVGIECEVRYLHLVLILTCEILGAAHVALIASDLTLGGDLAARCDVLCIQSDGDSITMHDRIIRLSPEFVREIFRNPMDDRDLEQLGNTWPATDIVRIGRTSGTSGRQKYVGFSRGALRNFANFLSSSRKLDNATFNYVTLYPFAHIATYNNCLLALSLGSTIIYSSGGSFPNDIRSLPTCHTVMLSRDAAEFLHAEQTRPGRVDTCTLSLVGGFVSPTLRAALREAVTTTIRSTYSMNEVGRVTANDDDGPGVMLPGVSIRIIDDVGHDREPGQPGIILIRTQWMADGYLWADAETAALFTDGWFHTSDIGIVPEPGKLIVLGRADEMLNIGGIKFAPHPIEARIRAIDGVTEAVLLVLDNVLGTGSLHVVIERRDRAQEREIEESVVSFLIGYVELFEIHYVDALPRTETGKVQRVRVRQSLEQRAGA
jgi:acyl-coenzyme A synthetase/AMP-(fatty) acid ligase